MSSGCFQCIIRLLIWWFHTSVL